MPTSRHPQKRCPSSPGPARPRPLVAPGDPPRRHTPRPAAHPACPHHRLVMLATRPPSQCTTFASEATNATVMLATGLGQVAVEGRLGDAHQPADLGDAVLLGAVELHRELALLGRQQLRPPAEPAPRPGRAEPGPGALADEGALELGERG